jgi:hypothetical protein
VDLSEEFSPHELTKIAREQSEIIEGIRMLREVLLRHEGNQGDGQNAGVYMSGEFCN